MSRLRRLRAVLVDLSGTIHVDDSVVPGATGALNRLADSKLNVKFVTNTTKESKRVLLERLTRIGFTIGPDQVFTSLTAARNLVRTRNLSPLMLLDTRAEEEFLGLPRRQKPDSVVVGLAPDKFDYDHMNMAFRLILDGAPLIAIHKARYYKRTDGLALGPGPFVSGLELAADAKAEVVGKPETSFFTEAVKEFNVTPDECIMIGDDARDDVGGAQRAGMLGILVKTGKYRAGDENKIDPPPFHTVTDIAEAVDYILEHCGEAS